MRTLAIAMVLAFVAGCGKDNSTSGGGMDLSASQDDLSGGGGGGGGGGGSGVVDDGGLTTDGGVVGTGCTTACDCMPGLGCFQGQCTATVQPIYCCGTATCVAGHVCQSSTGKYAQCGGGGGGQLDLAGFDPCPFIKCGGAMADQQCVRAGCTMCVAGGNGMACSK